MKRRVQLTLEYDGTGFSGWQSQTERPSVQGAVEAALQKVFNVRERVPIEGAGRTDAGVHALGQVAHFDLPDVCADRWQDGIEKMALAINFYLQDLAIVVVAAKFVHDDFHARFSAKMRKYRYVIYNRRIRSAFFEKRAWHTSAQLEIDKMKRAAELLEGKHNFNAFRSAHCQAKSSIRTITKIEIIRQNEFVNIEIAAKSFLHNQVRIIAGTLVQIGKAEHPPEQAKYLLNSRDRTKSGPTAPPYGLFFIEVEY